MLPQETYIIDVRSRSEFEQGHLEGALHHDVRRMELSKFPELPLDASIQVYCASGVRSARAVELMHMHGFKHVINLGGLAHR
jgi:hydroxyacylglutathione hydrolase